MAAKKHTTRTSAKRPAKRSSGSRAAEQKQHKESHRQRNAILCFAIALLLLFAVLIPAPDAAFWNAIHSGMFGLFGIGSFAVPAILGYVAIATAMDKDSRTITKVTALSCVLLLITETLIEVFVADVSGDYMLSLQAAFVRGTALFGEGGFNAGACGALLGFPLESLMSDIGAKILLFLALFVFVMLVTGATLMTLLKPIKKTADFTKERMIKKREKLREARECEENEETEDEPLPPKKEKTPSSSKGIDIDIGDGYSEAQIEKPDPRKTFETAAEELREDNDVIYMTNSLNKSYVYALFYSQTPPDVFIKTAEIPNPTAQFYDCTSFEGYVFDTSAIESGTSGIYIMPNGEAANYLQTADEYYVFELYTVLKIN